MPRELMFQVTTRSYCTAIIAKLPGDHIVTIGIDPVMKWGVQDLEVLISSLQSVLRLLNKRDQRTQEHVEP